MIDIAQMKYINLLQATQKIFHHPGDTELPALARPVSIYGVACTIVAPSLFI